ncbi:hypothetical protein PSPO01_12081 [Paraphaeosphaeria sporulosa]
MLTHSPSVLVSPHMTSPHPATPPSNTTPHPLHIHPTLFLFTNTSGAKHSKSGRLKTSTHSQGTARTVLVDTWVNGAPRLQRLALQQACDDPGSRADSRSPPRTPISGTSRPARSRRRRDRRRAGDGC